MARFRKPFFRESRGLWYVWHDGKQTNLGADKDAAFAAWHELTSADKVETPSASVASELVCVVIDAFLDYTEKHRSPDTYRWYKDRLQLFVNTIPATLTIAQLKPFHVQKWIDSYPDLSSGSKRNYCRSIQRAMNWAEEQGYVDRSPLAHFKKPAQGRKEQMVSSDEYRKLLAVTTDDEFHDLLTVTWETGCRPQESLRVEARHVDVQGSRWVFPASEAKGGKIPRVIYLSEEALKITCRLMLKYPQGPLFRNTDGHAWTPDATNCRFRTIKRKLKVKYSLYALRHSWITRKLMSGVDAFTVATLAGHSDPSMLAKFYSHLSQAPGYLLEQARRASA